MKSIPANRIELAAKFHYITDEFINELSEEVSAEQLRSRLLGHLIDAVPVAAFDPIQPWDEGILFYHRDVEEDEVVEFQHDLLRVNMNLKKDKPIKLNLSSVGGSVFAGLALVSTINDIQRSGREVNVHIQGVAMSMASVIAQVADHRTIEPGAFVMLHEIQYGMRGSTADHEEERDFTLKLQDAMYGKYSDRTTMPVEYYRKKLHKKQWYMTAQEALYEGLVDTVIDAPKYKQTPPKHEIERRMAELSARAAADATRPMPTIRPAPTKRKPRA